MDSSGLLIVVNHLGKYIAALEIKNEQLAQEIKGLLARIENLTKKEGDS